MGRRMELMEPPTKRKHNCACSEGSNMDGNRLDNDDIQLIHKMLTNEVQTAAQTLSSAIGELKESLKHHNHDRFAHGWDHQLLQESQQERKEWYKWRSTVDKKLWTLVGVSSTTGVGLSIILGNILSQHFH